MTGLASLPKGQSQMPDAAEFVRLNRFGHYIESSLSDDLVE
jgi:hypothetical protein